MLSAFGVDHGAFSKKDGRNRDVAAGAAGVAGAGTLAATPVRRSAAKVSVKGGEISAGDAKKIASPGYRPGNKKAIKVMARNLGHLENEPSTIIRYKGGHAIPFDGNHRMTARVARGDKSVPVKTIEGKERPAVSVTRNAYHVAQQRIHQRRMDRGTFTPSKSEIAPKKSEYIGRHRGESKTYKTIANASPARSSSRLNISASKFARGPSKAVLRTKQGLTVGTGAALLGTAGYLHRNKD